VAGNAGHPLPFRRKVDEEKDQENPKENEVTPHPQDLARRFEQIEAPFLLDCEAAQLGDDRGCGSRRSIRSLECAFAKVEKEREGETDSDRAEAHDRQPKVSYAQTLAFDTHKPGEHDGGHQDVQAEETADPVGEELTDKQTEVQAVVHDPRDELRVRESSSEDGEEQVNVFLLHGLASHWHSMA